MASNWKDVLLRALAGVPFQDETGNKGWFASISRAHPHQTRRLSLRIDGWPRWPRPMRIAFLSDFHCGSHADDVSRLRGLVAEAAAYRPDLVLLGGDFINMQPFGGGRIPPRTVAAILGELHTPLGAFAVLGNHDYSYGAGDVVDALRDHDIAALDDERRTLQFEGERFDLIGVPDAHSVREPARVLLSAQAGGRPAIVLAHDPCWFEALPAGPHLMLAGHTHGGQVRIAGRAVINSSRAPLRWSHGLIEEGGRRMYVTSGIGTSAIPLRVGIAPEIVLLDIAGPAEPRP